MLYPSDPSCSSSKVSALGSDERISERDPAVSFGHTRTPKFSIRDYVFASRSKGSGISWPFPCWLLEFFRKHGVEDLLPPFEPPSSVRHLRHRSSESEAEKIRISSPQVGETFMLDGQNNPTRIVSCLLLDDNFVSCLDKDKGQCSSDPEDKPDKLINDRENGSAVTVYCGIDKCSMNYGEPVVKKHRSILPGVISETSRIEEIASTFIASDHMASKVCPVCKTFSSTSNTTLNAHMDQCLSMASDANLTVDEIPKLKVKPRKKRLMEDIYVTASHCSLEDLDRRNGTSWAASLNLVSAPNEDNSEAKKLELSQVDTRDERSEDAVYVDSNGIKLCILSKLSDTSQVISREVSCRPRKSIKHVRDGNIISASKKKISGEKHSKKLKLIAENNKLRSLKLFRYEAAPEAAQYEEAREEERPVQLSGELNQAQASHETATLQRWSSSKSPDLPKKICKKDFIKSLEHSELVAQMKNLDTRKPASGVYTSARRHIKLPQSLESRMMDFKPCFLKKKEKTEKSFPLCLSKGTSTNTICCQLSKTSGALELSPRTRNDEFCKQKFHEPPLKTIRISALTGSNSSNQKIGKHHSVLRTTKKKKEFFVNNNGEQRKDVEAAIIQDKHITDQCLNTRNSQFQDAKQSCSKWDSKVSFDRVDDSSLTAKYLYGEGTTKSVIGDGTCLVLASDDKRNVAMPTGECEMMMEQLLPDKGELTSNKLEGRCLESEAGAVSTESSACLTSHGDLEPDIQRENYSIASALVFQNHDNPAIIRELSGSPSSNSFIVNSSLKSSDTKASERDFGLFMDQNQQQSDYHHCCCSHQGIMTGTMPTSKPKVFPNLYIKPSIPSILGAYSGLRTEVMTAASLKSFPGSMMARACNNAVGSTSPSCGTPSQSSSNSILRLMGKDLMISHNESSNLPKVGSPANDNNLTVQSFSSPLSFASCTSIPNHDSFPYADHSPAPLMSNMQPVNHLPCAHQSSMNNEAHLNKDVILINDSSDDEMMMKGTSFPVPATHAMFQRLSPYFAPHNQFLPCENGYVINEGSSLDVPAPLLPRLLMFRSPSAAHLNAPFYYP